MVNIAKNLRAKYSQDEVYILSAKQNSGSFTYDGIELGGERVCAEIEEEIRLIESKGGHITKLSIVGYSLGGLVSRYAVGLLHAKGILDTVECMVCTARAFRRRLITNNALPELCHVRKPPSRCTNPPKRLAQPRMEYFGRKDSIHVWPATLLH